MDSAVTCTLIPLQKSQNTKLWQYCGFRSDDGTSITKGHKSVKVCEPAAADDHPTTHAGCGDVGGRPMSSIGNSGGHRNGQAAVVTRN